MVKRRTINLKYVPETVTGILKDSWFGGIFDLDGTFFENENFYFLSKVTERHSSRLLVECHSTNKTI